MTETAAAPAAEATTTSADPVSGAEQTGTPSAPPAEKKYKVTVDGREMEVSEKDLLSGYQMSAASRKRFEEAAKLSKEVAAQQKQFERFFETLVKNPRQVLTDPRLAQMGLDFDKFVEDYVIERLDYEKLSPAEREAKEAKAKLAKYEQDEEHRRQQQMTAQERAEEARHAQEFVSEVAKVLQTENIPKTNLMVQRIAYAKLRALEAEYDAPMAELLADVREATRGEFQEYLGAYEGQALLEELGEDLLGKIRRAELARLRAGQKKAQPEDNPFKPRQDKPKQYMSLDERLKAFVGE